MRAIRRRVMLFVLLPVIVLGGIIFFGVPWWFDIAFNDDLYAQKGSIEYYVTFPPGEIRRMPEINVVGEVMYSYGIGDGPAPLHYGIHYTSRSPRKVVERKIFKYFDNEGFTISHREEGKLSRTEFQRSDREDLEVVLYQKDDGTTGVNATLLQW